MPAPIWPLSFTAMKTLKDNGTFDALVSVYISKGGGCNPPELKPVENSKGTLVMGTNCEFEPFEYLTSAGSPPVLTWTSSGTSALRWAMRSLWRIWTLTHSSPPSSPAGLISLPPV